MSGASEEEVFGGVTLGWALDIVSGVASDLTGMVSSLYGLGVKSLQIRWQKSRIL